MWEEQRGKGKWGSGMGVTQGGGERRWAVKGFHKGRKSKKAKGRGGGWMGERNYEKL